MPQTNEPKPKKPVADDQAPETEAKEELTQEELDDVAGGLLFVGGTTAVSGGTASATLIEDDEPLIP